VRRISVRIPEQLYELIEELVESGEYKSKADVIREAIKELLREKVWMQEGEKHLGWDRRK